MNGNANKGSGLEELRQPLTVDGATVILHFASACENDGESVNGLDTIREILLAIMVPGNRTTDLKKIVNMV